MDEIPEIFHDDSENVSTRDSSKPKGSSNLSDLQPTKPTIAPISNINSTSIGESWVSGPEFEEYTLNSYSNIFESKVLKKASYRSSEFF